MNSPAESIRNVEQAKLESAVRPAINKCVNCGCNDWKNLISITYNYNLPENFELLTKESKKIVEERKSEYEKKLKEYNRFMETGVDMTSNKHYEGISKRSNQSEKVLKSWKPKIWNPYINQNYCGYCKLYFQELEIQRLGGVSIRKENENSKDIKEAICDLKDNLMWKNSEITQLLEENNNLQKQIKQLLENKLNEVNEENYCLIEDSLQK